MPGQDDTNAVPPASARRPSRWPVRSGRRGDPGGGQSVPRRAFLSYSAALGAGAAVASLSACGGTSIGAGGTTGSGAAPGQIGSKLYPFGPAQALNRSLHWPRAMNEPGQKVTLTVAHTWTPDMWVRQQQFDKFFMERHPNIVLNAQNTPAADYQTKYSVQAAAGSLPDVMYVQWSFAQQYIKARQFAVLDSYMATQPGFDIGDFTKPSMPFYQRDGHTYGIPYDCAAILLAYNKDLFDKAGLTYPQPNWTLDDVLAAARKLTSGSGPDKIYGFGSVANISYPYAGALYLEPFGARFLNQAQTRCVTDSPAAVSAMDWWVNELGRYGPSFAEYQAISESGESAFLLGRAGMDFGASWLASILKAQTTIRFGFTNWPRGPVARTTGVTGSSYAITRGSQNKDAAWIYLNEYTSTAGLTFMFSSTGGASPARASAWPYYLHSKNAPDGGELFLSTLNSYATTDGVDYLPQEQQILQALTPVWDKVWARQESVAAGLHQANALVQPMLSGGTT